MIHQLDRPCTVEEVELALKQMSPFKSPGPDGFSAGFYQDHWKILSHDLSKTVMDFFKHKKLPKGWNHTHLVLIPKVKSPNSVHEYRPISLCNVNYKLISKVLAHRLKVVLDKVISWNQSAFIPNRLITDNIMVAYELLHSMHVKRKGRAGSMAIKLDMSKAYDRVEWDFLETMLLKLGFSHYWTELVMECVKSVSYSVVINGELGEIFVPTRGLRQGDPLYPYLFLICAEGLSTMLNIAESNGLIKGASVTRGGMRINHLLFTDDCVIFCRAMLNEWYLIYNLLM